MYVVPIFCSKDGTSGLRDAAVADDSRILFLDLRPETLCRPFLHFDLDVVLSNLAFTEVELARIFDKHTCVRVFDDVVQDMSCGLAGRKDSRSCVLYNLVVLDFALGVDEDNAILVLLDLIVFNQKLLLAFNNENTLSTL